MLNIFKIISVRCVSKLIFSIKQIESQRGKNDTDSGHINGKIIFLGTLYLLANFFNEVRRNFGTVKYSVKVDIWECL